MESQEVPGTVTGGLRQRNKAKRRDAIINSALELLRVAPLSELSVDRIADLAEVSPATVYNLVGTREQLLVACVNQVIENLVEELVHVNVVGDPIAAALAVVDISSEAFIADRNAFRQIVSSMNGLAQSGVTVSFDAGQLQIAAMRAAQQRGLIRKDVDAEAVGRQVYLSYNGALFAWAAGMLTDDGFRVAAQHGLWSALVAYASKENRDSFVDQLHTAGKKLAKAGYGVS